MGSASRVTPGRLHNDSLAASLPIENSPPGIHTIPSGARVGADVLFGTVGAKGELAAAALFSFASAVATGSAGRGRNMVSATSPATTTVLVASQRIPFVLSGVAGFFPLPDICLLAHVMPALKRSLLFATIKP
jgi:hypothetical protein